MSIKDNRPTLDQRLAQLRADRGDTVPLAEVGDNVQSLLTGVTGDVTSGELRARQEVVELLDFLREARAEIANIRPNSLTKREIPAATDELDAVIKSTEAATFTILNAAESLSALAPKLEGEAVEVVNQVVTDIYEASNFQDISGQRITKVVKTLRQIEERLTRLATTLGVEADVEPAESALDPNDPKRLLSGPQLPDLATNQDDIDALFDSL